MIVTTRFFEDILKCYAFHNIPKSLAKNFTAACLDIDYFQEETQESQLVEQKPMLADPKAFFTTKIPMAKQADWQNHWFQKYVETSIEAEKQGLHGYVLSAKWECDPSCDTRENTIFWTVEEFPVQDISKTLEETNHKNGILLLSKHGNQTAEEFKGLFTISEQWITIDENAVFHWIDREDGKYIKYSSDDEGERISIFEKQWNQIKNQIK